MEKVIDIEVPELGILSGRDCVFIDTVTQKDSNLIFKGKINGNLVNIKKRKYIKYNLTFNDVIAYFSCELDTYYNLNPSWDSDTSSFSIIENSKLLADFPIRKDFDKSDYKHYQLYTYDDVFNIIAQSFDLNY